ncbi:hypothetical protein [Pseudomonas corrugata]|uniref:hypothetical protein n=1 Tax=Pseudomonas corrugata TaxID=47879 RepID=UPI0022349ECD|nr:hypothetical protein [Pseudomonas corrugata]UZE08156.1 hypothetical protein LOY65_09645 [Pseudomonas corrugata]
MAVIAAAGKMGICSDELCAQAVGGLMSDHYWSWANAQHAQGAADEIDNALNVLLRRPMAQMKSPDAEVGDGVTFQLPSQACN